MSPPDDNSKHGNVVRLGTETLYVIGDELRRMYDADLRSKPSERLDRLMSEFVARAAADGYTLSEILERLRDMQSEAGPVKAKRS